jgi:hypothetical protein
MEIVPERNRLDKRQLWGVAVESNFLKPLSETTFGAGLATLGRIFREPPCRLVLGRRFGKHVCRIAVFGNTFGEHFWHIFVELRREQRWGAALGRSFEEQLSTAALKNFSSGEHLGDRIFGEQLAAATLGSVYKQRWGAQS